MHVLDGKPLHNDRGAAQDGHLRLLTDSEETVASISR